MVSSHCIIYFHLCGQHCAVSSVSIVWAHPPARLGVLSYVHLRKTSHLLIIYMQSSCLLLFKLLDFYMLYLS